MEDQYTHKFLRKVKVRGLPLSVIHFHTEGTLQAIAESIMEVASSHTVNYQDTGTSYLTLLFFRMCIISVQIEMLILRDRGSGDCIPPLHKFVFCFRSKSSISSGTKALTL